MEEKEERKEKRKPFFFWCALNGRGQEEEKAFFFFFPVCPADPPTRRNTRIAPRNRQMKIRRRWTRLPHATLHLSIRPDGAFFGRCSSGVFSRGMLGKL